MPQPRDRPKGAELDHLVLWAIHVLEAPIYTSDVTADTAIKTDRWEVDANDHNYYQQVSRALARCEKSGVIENDEFDGWRFTEIPS